MRYRSGFADQRSSAGKVAYGARAVSSAKPHRAAHPPALPTESAVIGCKSILRIFYRVALEIAYPRAPMKQLQLAPRVLRRSDGSSNSNALRLKHV
ncbi:hypothetical protein PCAR4_760003 [Paraburkholderia caribensis]|nr:hypothetical protein PCAR4_760003 [Paraburkholderia caribensis]